MHIESKERSGEFAGPSLKARSSLRVEGKLVALSGRGRGWRLQLKLVHRTASLIKQRGLRPARQVPRHHWHAHAGSSFRLRATGWGRESDEWGRRGLVRVYH